MTTPKRAEWETLFKDFPAQKQYKIFNEGYNICYNRSYCDDLSIPDPKKRGEIINLCKKIACKYINLPDIVRSERKYSDRCSYFIHWAQDVIRKHFKVDLASNYYYHFIFKLIDVAREISWEDLKSPPCQRLFDSDFKHWEVEKDIHDYFKNVDTLSKKIDTDVDKRNSYLEYLTYIKRLYENNYRECCDPYDISYSNCPNYFVCNPNFHPNELIAKINPDTQVRRVTVIEQRGQTGSRGGSTLQGKSARYNTRNQGAYCPTGTTYDYKSHTCKTPEGLSFKVVDYGTHYDLPTLDNQFGSGDNTGMVVPGSNSEGSNTYRTFRLGFSAFLGLVIGVVFYLFIKRTTPIGQVLGGKKRKGKKTAEEAMVEIHEEEQLGGNNVNADAQWDGYAADAQWGGYNAGAQWDDHHADAQWDDHHADAQWDDHHGEGQWDDHHADAHWDDHHGEGQWDDHHADAQWDEHHADAQWDDRHGGHWDDHHGEGHWDDHHGEGHWDDDHRGGGSSDYSNSYDNDRQLRFSYQPSYEPYD